MKIAVSILAVAPLIVATAQEQTEPKPGFHIQHDVITAGPKDGAPKENVMFERHAMAFAPASTVQFISAEGGVAGKPVKNAPYSAEAVTETSQMLSDGNRISNKSSSATYRDSEGRTRREMTMPTIGPASASAEAPSIVWINDPVSGVNYQLDVKQKTARKMPDAPFAFSVATDTPAPAGDGIRMRTNRLEAGRAIGGAVGGAVAAPMLGIHATSAVRLFNKDAAPPKTESLGKQAMGGVEVEGTRSTITIPAGEIGNEREISIVTERWYSSELQTVVMSKHTDPRMGETVYKLTNIRKDAPHPSLFEVPADYTLSNAEPPPFRMMRRVEKDKEE